MKKCLYSILSVAFFAVLCSLGFSQNSFAANLDTSSFDILKNDGSWTNNIKYNQNISLPYGVGIKQYQFNTPVQTFGGNYATIHFETNIVATSPNYDSRWYSFVNLNYIDLITCVASSASIEKVSSNIAYNLTDWSGTNTTNQTLTLYGDYTFKINSGTSSSITCAIGSNDFNFLIGTRLNNSANIYFEQNPATITYTTNNQEALLQQQINQQNTIINQNATIIEGVGQTTDAVNNMSQNLQNKLDEQTQQEQDQYDQEKQEESEREESGNEDADQMSGIFQFSIPNPFLPILSMFTDGGSCVSIPTIASMVGSDNTQFCPWFPASVRNVLTPVIGLSSSIILFGFIISWLTGATRGSVEEVVEVSK